MIDCTNFSDFTYSKNCHFDFFKKYIFDLYGENMEPADTRLKFYQDLLAFSFIDENIPEGSKILEIGGGNSRIINRLKNKYEFWNLDKLEGVGSGPKTIESDGFKLVKDYIGNFNRELPLSYFDFIFSISVFEHLQTGDYTIFQNILEDINRLLKPGGSSLHCVDAIIKEKNRTVWIHPIIKYIFENQETVNQFISPDIILEDRDVYFISKSAYNRFWKPVCKIKYKDYGKPISYNLLWRT